MKNHTKILLVLLCLLLTACHKNKSFNKLIYVSDYLGNPIQDVWITRSTTLSLVNGVKTGRSGYAIIPPKRNAELDSIRISKKGYKDIFLEVKNDKEPVYVELEIGEFDMFGMEKNNSNQETKSEDLLKNFIIKEN